ncbi:MAG: universal stress protein [Betaproteobacteria bacterium HGW-Betaproteobacteria-17]|nr:MAG: universal stress protein [Betaproteobacteria bacterium HGW-Betaproteobacteria-17]
MTSPLSVLATTDFSAPARHALERAAQLAAAHPGAQLTLAHVVSASMLARLRGVMRDEAPAMEARVAAETQQALTELAARLGAQYACPVNTRLAQRVALDAITELADELQANLLVMGARGAHFVREFLLGSTTERVLRRTRRPVLAVKQRPQGAYRRVLVPVDFSVHALAAAQAAHRWLPDAEIVLLHAYEVDIESTLRFASIAEEKIHAYRVRAREEALDSMAQFVDLLSIPAAQLTRLVVHGAPTLRILEHEQSLDTDLIVMGKHGQSTLEELLLGSVTKHVLAYSSSDVLIAGHPS